MTSLYTDQDHGRVSEITKVAAPEPFRSPWRRDIARLLHCPSFRRLQAKTQVFPGNDSDFFRTRLTHSLEVAQIAKSIAIRLNATHDFFKVEERNINSEIVEFAALAHDLGHPPFGHNGEEALHEKMNQDGGFEGNAQTIHILTKVEKKERSNLRAFDAEGNDTRLGLNIAYRTLASVLKYDSLIPEQSGSKQKGYYRYDASVVEKAKTAVLRNNRFDRPFKTIECSIMDIADDIAYSTYDLEDCMKAGLLTPLDLFALLPDVKRRVVATIQKRLRNYLGNQAAVFDEEDLIEYLFLIFSEMFQLTAEEEHFLDRQDIPRDLKKLHEALQVTELSKRISNDGYERVKTTSDLVQRFMDGVIVDVYEPIPAMSNAKLDVETFKKVEVLKNITYEAVIMSPRMRVVEYRGYDVIRHMFDAIHDSKNGYLLLPDDYRDLFLAAPNKQAKRRIVCDFIAGMTDRYAWQFYNRICGSDPMTIHVPV